MSAENEREAQSPKLHAVLSLARIYEGFQRMVGARRAREILSTEYLTARTGESVLDMGCGPGGVLDALPAVDYVGFDPSLAYIRAAREQYGDRGVFLHGGVEDFGAADFPGPFDLVIAQGVLHHVDDDTATRLFQLGRECMYPNGRLVTIDPALSSEQSRIAAAVIRRDRGRYVRRSAEYGELAAQRFEDVTVSERHDLLRIPYTHAIVQCALG